MCDVSFYRGQKLTLTSFMWLSSFQTYPSCNCDCISLYSNRKCCFLFGMLSIPMMHVRRVCTDTLIYILLHTFHGNHYYYDLIANEVEIERNNWKRWTNERNKIHMICICVLLLIDQLFISHNAELQRRDDACFVSVFDWNFSKGLFYNLFCISVPHRASLNISKRILLCLRGWSFCRAVCPCLDSRFFLLQPSIALSLCRLSTGSNYKKFQQFFFLSLLL